MIKLPNRVRLHDVRVVYRLIGSPVLRDEHRCAKILGALARMELGPVTCDWFSRRTGLKPRAALALLEDICAQGCAKRIAVPAADTDSGLGEIPQTSGSDFAGLEDVHQQPQNRLRGAYEFLRRVM